MRSAPGDARRRFAPTADTFISVETYDDMMTDWRRHLAGPTMVTAIWQGDVVNGAADQLHGAILILVADSDQLILITLCDQYFLGQTVYGLWLGAKGQGVNTRDDGWPVPVFVLTGFLGSGKTSLLANILRQPAFANTAVLINEFGEVGLDHLLVSHLDDDIVLLESGCVCCNIGDNLIGSLIRLMGARGYGGTPAFDRIILETTGIADPAPILQAVAGIPELLGQIAPGAVITVVDAALGADTLSSHAQALNQIAMADTVILTKQDIAPPDQTRALATRLRDLAPGAPVLTPDEVAADPSRLFKRHRANTATIGKTAHDHGYGYHSFCLSWPQPLNWDDFLAWTEGLLGARGDDILRLKGLLWVQDQPGPIVVQAVQHMLFKPDLLCAWPQGKPCSQLVVIARHLTPTAVKRSRAPFFPNLRIDQ